MIKKKINVGIIGCGYWAKNIINEIRKLDIINIVHLCDINYEATRQYQTIYRITNKPNEVFENPDVDAVIIATRVGTHFELSKEAIRNKKHVWIEKPMARSSNDAVYLVELAKHNNVIIHVDHTFIYSNPIKSIKNILDTKTFGNIRYIESTRCNYGPFPTDINVIEDLAPHDFSILNYFTNNEKPTAISATGSYSVNKSTLDKSRITCFYKNFNAYINVSWVDTIKSRKVLVYSDRGFISNDSAIDENINIHRFDINNFRLESTLHTDNLIKNKSSLSVELEHFYDCVINNITSNLSSGHHGVIVMEAIEAANESALNKGIPIYL